MTHYEFKGVPAQFVLVIYQALGELPMKLAGPVFSLLDGQKREQDAKPPADPPKDHSDKVL